jgi:hypothetical protein
MIYVCLLSTKDSFEHEAGNSSSTEPRVVLVIDIWHPDLTDEEIRFLEFINNAQVKAAMKLHELGTLEKRANVDHDDINSDSFYSIIMEAKRQGILCADEDKIWK